MNKTVGSIPAIDTRTTNLSVIRYWIYSYNITHRQEFGTVLGSAFTRIVATASTGDALLQGHWPISSRVSLSFSLSHSVLATIGRRWVYDLTGKLRYSTLNSLPATSAPSRPWRNLHLSKWKYKHYLLERKCFT